MTSQELRDAHRAVPFRPFTIRMVDGRVFSVSDPDLIAISPRGRTALVYQKDDSSSHLDLFEITEIAWLPAPTPPA